MDGCPEGHRVSGPGARNPADPRPGLCAVQAANELVQHGVEPRPLDVQHLVDLGRTYSCLVGCGEVPVQRGGVVEEAASMSWIRTGQVGIPADTAPGRINGPLEQERAFLPADSRSNDPGACDLTLNEDRWIPGVSQIVFVKSTGPAGIALPDFYRVAN